MFIYLFIYFILFYFILFYFILFYFILFYFILFYYFVYMSLFIFVYLFLNDIFIHSFIHLFIHRDWAKCCWLSRKTSNKLIHFQWQSLLISSWLKYCLPGHKSHYKSVHSLGLIRVWDLFVDIFYNICWVCRRVVRALIELRSLICAFVDHICFTCVPHYII